MCFKYKYTKTNCFCLMEKSMDRINKEMTDCKKTFAISKTDNNSVYKKFLLSPQDTDSPREKIGKNMNRQLK